MGGTLRPRRARETYRATGAASGAYAMEKTVYEGPYRVTPGTHGHVKKETSMVSVKTVSWHFRKSDHVWRVNASSCTWLMENTWWQTGKLRVNRG